MLNRLKSILLIDCEVLAGSDFLLCAIFGGVLKQSGEQVMLRVSNTLADCTALDIDRVFEPFYRMDAQSAGGSGLGLYVVKMLCDRLGWTVCAELNHNQFEIIIQFSREELL